VTALTYDPRGRSKTSSASAETTSYDYDGMGNDLPPRISTESVRSLIANFGKQISCWDWQTFTMTAG